MRVQLALNVSNLEESIDFYRRMFDAEPARLRPGYANFAIDNPPLKLVLFEGAGAPGSINHLGVESESSDEVELAHKRLMSAGLVPDEVQNTECCYATKTETWVNGPDDSKWEWYVRTGDSEQLINRISDSEGSQSDSSCCK